MLSILLCQEPRVVETEVMPLLAKDSHDLCSCVWMLLPLRPIHIWLSQVANVMNKEGHPEPWITRKSIELPPCSGYEPWVDGELMSTEEDAFGSDFHLFPSNLLISSSIYHCAFFKFSTGSPLS